MRRHWLTLIWRRLRCLKGRICQLVRKFKVSGVEFRSTPDSLANVHRSLRLDGVDRRPRRQGRAAWPAGRWRAAILWYNSVMAKTLTTIGNLPPAVRAALAEATGLKLDDERVAPFERGWCVSQSSTHPRCSRAEASRWCSTLGKSTGRASGTRASKRRTGQ